VNTILLSVILPTYNVEKYIDKCLRSLEAQCLDHSIYEIIVVDDGSTDDSVVVVRNLQLEFSNIVIRHQQNSGQGAARNAGLLEAKGKYILFVDPDDYIEENCLAEMLDIITGEEGLDFVGYNFVIHFNSGLDNIPEYAIPGPNPVSGVRFYNEFVSNHYYIWRYIFNRGFLIDNNLFFLEGVTFEDVELIPRLMSYAKKTRFHNLVFYHYVIRPGSTMTTRAEKHIWSRISAAENLYRFKEELLVSKDIDVLHMLDNMIAEFLLTSVSAAHAFPGKLGQLSRRIRMLPFYPVDVTACTRGCFRIRVLNRSIYSYWLYSYLLFIFGTVRHKVRSGFKLARTKILTNI
jgi:glycosyltransferase involved in cell wall biosynthesis